MHSLERERSAADRRNASKLLAIVDEIHVAQNLAEVGHMATSALTREEGRAIAELLAAIENTLTNAAAELTAALANKEDQINAA